MMIKIVVIIYAIQMFITVLTRNDSSKSVSKVVRDLSYDTTKHYIGKNKFAFAVKLVGPNSELIWDRTYFDLVVSYTNYVRNNNGTDVRDYL